MKQLVINVGGQGKRLRQITGNLPKPMVEIRKKPLLEHIILWAASYGIRDILLLTGYGHNYIYDYFNDGSKWNVSISYSHEVTPLGSGGALRNAEDYLEKEFIYINGDLYTKMNLKRFIDFHKSKKISIATVSVIHTDHPEDSDLLILNKSDNKVIKFISKKHENKDLETNLANAGLCIFSKQIMKYMRKNSVFDLETYLYPILIQNNSPLFAYVTEEAIIDVGTPERLNTLNELLNY